MIYPSISAPNTPTIIKQYKSMCRIQSAVEMTTVNYLSKADFFSFNFSFYSLTSNIDVYCFVVDQYRILKFNTFFVTEKKRFQFRICHAVRGCSHLALTYAIVVTQTIVPYRTIHIMRDRWHQKMEMMFSANTTLRPTHTERKRKFSLMFVIYSLICRSVLTERTRKRSFTNIRLFCANITSKFLQTILVGENHFTFITT